MSVFDYTFKQNNKIFRDTWSLPALSNVCPSSDNDKEVTDAKCFSSTAMHFLLSRLQTRTLVSSLPENNWGKQHVKGHIMIASAEK